MCVENIYTDRYPDGREIEFRQVSVCQYGQPGKPCDLHAVLENPLRNIQFGEPTSEYLLTKDVTRDIQRNARQDGANSRKSAPSQNSFKLYESLPPRRSNDSPVVETSNRRRTDRRYQDGRTYQSHGRKERIIIIDEPPIRRTVPSDFDSEIERPVDPVPVRQRPIIVDERLARRRTPSVELVEPPIVRPQNYPRVDYPDDAGVEPRNLRDPSPLSFDFRAERELRLRQEERERDAERYLDERGKFEAEIRPPRWIREQDEERRRRPAVYIAPRSRDDALNTTARRRSEDRWREQKRYEDRESDLRQLTEIADSNAMKERLSSSKRRHRVYYDDGIYRWDTNRPFDPVGFTKPSDHSETKEPFVPVAAANHVENFDADTTNLTPDRIPRSDAENNSPNEAVLLAEQGSEARENGLEHLEDSQTKKSQQVSADFGNERTDFQSTGSRNLYKTADDVYISDNLTRQHDNYNSQSRGNRYDFGDSLSAAMNHRDNNTPADGRSTTIELTAKERVDGKVDVDAYGDAFGEVEMFNPVALEFLEQNPSLESISHQGSVNKELPEPDATEWTNSVFAERLEANTLEDNEDRSLDRKSSKSKIPTGKELDDLKPEIRELYVDQGLTLAQLANHLREHYGTTPTISHLRHLILKWDFEKNVKENKRHALFEELGPAILKVDFEARKEIQRANKLGIQETNVQERHPERISPGKTSQWKRPGEIRSQHKVKVERLAKHFANISSEFKKTRAAERNQRADKSTSSVAPEQILLPELKDSTLNTPFETVLESASLDISDGESTTSMDTHSIFSAEDSISSRSSIASNLGAPDELAALLSTHDDLKPLLRKASQSLDGSTFKEGFASLLRRFSSDLNKEAEKATELLAVNLVRHSRRKVAYAIWKDCYGIGSGPSISGALDHRRMDKARKMEETLKRLNLSEQIGPTEGSEDVAPDENSSGDEEIYQTLPNLKQVKKFLVSGQAFQKLVKHFMELLETKSNKLESIAEDEVEPPSSFPRSDLPLLPQRHEGVSDAFNHRTSIYHPHDTTHSTYSPKKVWRGSIVHLQRLFRPRTPSGFRRLEWQMECGTWLYDDYDNSDAAQVELFYSELTGGRLLEATNGVQQRSPGFASNTPVPTGLSCSSTSSSSSQTSAASTVSSLSTQSSNSSTTAIPLKPISSLPPVTPLIRKFFAICVNTSSNLSILGEIDVSNIDHDGEWFAKMWSEYDRLRGFRNRFFRRLLIKPVDIKYVQFTVEEHQRADISFDPPVIPPPAEVAARNYEYTPCPLTTRPSPQTFLHYRDCLSCTSSREKKKKLFRRLPKKLSQGLLDMYLRAGPDEDVLGWGVLIVEGPNKASITMLSAVILTLSVVVAVVYTGLTKDASSGFTIGSFLVTIWVSWVTALYYHWKES